MTELYGWRPTSSAKVYLDENEQREAGERAQQRIAEANDRSRAWLERYHQAPQRTAFNWSPRFPVTTTKENSNAEEAEDSFNRVSQAAAESDLQKDVGDAAGASTGDCAERRDPERDGARKSERADHDWISDPIPF